MRTLSTPRSRPSNDLAFGDGAQAPSAATRGWAATPPQTRRQRYQTHTTSAFLAIAFLQRAIKFFHRLGSSVGRLKMLATGLADLTDPLRRDRGSVGCLQGTDEGYPLRVDHIGAPPSP